MGRPREFDREKALSDAMLLFWRKGFHATSLRDLGDALGIRMPSLYAAFGSKEALYAEAVGQYMRQTQTLLWQQMEDVPSSKEAIRRLLLATAGEVTNLDVHPIGCMVSFATVDEDMPTNVVAAIRNARSDWKNVIRERLAIAVANGELADSIDLDSLSRFYAGVVQSLGIQAHDGALYPELEKVVEHAMAAWPTAGGVSGTPRKA
jgi:AcrR family transcriptional regulator